MRGKDAAQFFNQSLFRITPAYAGKSHQLHKLFKLHRDHPRLCGEKLELYVDLFHDKGSPPPMRGKVIKIIQTSCSWRITPAYAGKSLLEQEIYDTNTDHPRLCGEKSLTVDKTPFVLGSPPPMRGKVETQNLLTT